MAVAPAQRSFGAGERVAVLLPLPLAGAYDYQVAEASEVAAGDFVEVPLGGRRLIGVVWGGPAGAIEEGRLKVIRRRLEAPPLPEVSRRFVDWVAGYTLSPPGAVLRMAISVPSALLPPRPVAGYRLADGAPDLPDLRMTPARTRVLELAQHGPPRPIVELAREAGVGTAVVRGLITAGVLRATVLAEPPPPVPDWRRPGVTLTPEQAAAAEILRGSAQGGFGVILLDGIAGSGKTEVYFEAIAAALAHGRQVLVLLPEIALSAQWLHRFAARFAAAPMVWHSEVSPGQRRRIWRAVADGTAKVVVGARSALFLPFADLGLIVVDEEHDASFKQEDGVLYHARDMAVVRARLSDTGCILASATPSLETVLNVRNRRYRAVALPARPDSPGRPEIAVIDLRRQPPPRGGFIAPPLRAELLTTLSAGGQALLFLNRRGYAPLTLCRACGHRLHCPSCTAWLVEHRLIGRLQCHHCGHREPLPAVCPRCGAADSLAACGPGVERLAEEVAAFLPQARLALATSDTLTGPQAAAALVRRIEDHEIDLIIGTQIVAKGYHFPLLTLVGVVDADLGLAGGDLRAAERTFQLLAQVGGRAGRGTRAGKVLLQSCQPEHPVIAALIASDRERFFEAELAARAAVQMPPFGRLAAVIVSARDEAAAEEVSRALARAAPRDSTIRVLGPAPAPLALLRGRHRRRLLLHSTTPAPVPAIVRRWLDPVRWPSSVRVQIDIDPISFL